jgi:hypothetical protein
MIAEESAANDLRATRASVLARSNRAEHAWRLKWALRARRRNFPSPLIQRIATEEDIHSLRRRKVAQLVANCRTIAARQTISPTVVSYGHFGVD